MLIIVVGVCLLRVAWIFGASTFMPGALGVAMAYPVSWTTTGLVSLIYYLRGGWRRRLTRVEERLAQEVQAEVAVS